MSEQGFSNYIQASHKRIRCNFSVFDIFDCLSGLGMMDGASLYRKQGSENVSLFKRCSKSGVYNQHQIPASLELQSGGQRASNAFHTARDELVRYFK